MRVLVTGGSGGVGSFVVKELLAKQYQVACLARDPKKITDSAVAIIQGDLSEIPAIEKQFAEFRPEAIVHLGWIGVDQKEKSNPGQIHNLQTAVDLLQLAQKYQVKSFIGMGSESEYGVHNKKIDETASNKPLTKYAIAKFATGLMMEKMCKDAGMNFTWLRLFSSYGPGDRPGSLMSLMIKTLLKNEPMNLSECVQVWDYVHARDIARLIGMILQNPKESGFFNLGGGHACVLKEVVHMIANKIDPNAELHFGAIPYGPNQNMHLEADISKLKKVYGWEPQISLEEGLSETIAWHRQQLF
ncbi:NAD(P)-dependent oxidoreductase [Bdellovibrio sp. NC01]|uniref:NAD-dependent epimerase/dehydratase family protein n=1 Tax=Bdellovibrio sp. NC01 TaxID=2220073 RepID=UPI00115B8A96|nr:NAD(P)-dependent oxidoreductase [Bdellovibrio sp. NC01]QDK37500.1 NAD(P)-dependent oxidoreductase [Bdellovibrio sp. NC01]